MNNDFTAINRNLRDLTHAIREQNKRMLEINSNLSQILYILKESRDGGTASDFEGNVYCANNRKRESRTVYEFAITKDNPTFDADDRYMESLIAAYKRYLNDIFQDKGFVTLNEACRMFRLYEDPLKCCIGWVYGETEEIDIDYEHIYADNELACIRIRFSPCANIIDILGEHNHEDTKAD